MRVLTVAFLGVVALLSGSLAYGWRSPPESTVPPITLRSDADEAAKAPPAQPRQPQPQPQPQPLPSPSDGGAVPVPANPTPVPSGDDDDDDGADAGSDDGSDD